MGITLKPKHLKRYGQIAALLMKYGRSDLVRNAGLEAVLEDTAAAEAGDQPEAEELAADLEAMGPTFTKLGQLLSSRVDLVPPAYIAALTRLQESVQPFGQEEAERIVQEELGVKLRQAFSEFDPVPVAAASLGQVHRAKLPSGREVAVKVQRPDVRETVVNDLEVLRELAVFFDNHTEAGVRYRFEQALDEMGRALLDELDYRREAANLRSLGQQLAEFERIVIPQPVPGYVTGRVLTMDYVHGRKITAMSPLIRMELDGAALADELFEAYLKQVLDDGLFHADPHPGNVFLTEDHRIALIDVGMVGRLPPELQDGMLRMLLAMSEGRGRDAADVAIDMGVRTELFDQEGFRQEIARQVLRFYTSSAEELQYGRMVMDLTRAAADHGLIIPAQLTMLGKTLLNLDLIGRTLDPGFQPNLAIQRHAGELMRRRMMRSASPGHLLATLLETNDFVQRLPGRLNRVLDAITERELEVNVRVLNESVLLSGLQKIANRIAAAAVLAALILASALLMPIETNFRILGYPGLAIMLLLVAAVGAGILLFDIVSHDRTESRRRGPSQ
jgi:ubiquinone biosynthesis protein